MSVSPPSVTVIVPVGGSRGELTLAVSALDTQDYAGAVEVIVADNGDNADLPAERDGLRVVHEARPGSYAARNAGVAAASGEVLAFTDADCRPAPGWLTAGVRRLAGLEEPAFVGGAIDVELLPAGARTGASLWDRLHGLPQETFVSRDGWAATANLLVRRSDFDRVGPFDERLKSGGDREWGERAVRAGLRPVYAPEVVVHHPPRASLAELQRKTRRVQQGWRDVEQDRGGGRPALRNLAWSLTPHTRSVLRASRRLAADGVGPVERARYVATAHWLQYYGTWAWLRALRGGA